MKWIGFVLVGLVSLVLAVSIGSTSIPLADALNALRGVGDPTNVVIVRELRLPRAFLAYLIGGSLAITGSVLQALVRNPLAEPYLLGLSGGAGLAAVIAIATGAGGLWSVPVAAAIGALVAIALVYRIAVVAGGILDTRILLFAGVVVSAFSTAIMGAVLALSPATELRNAMLWLLGGFGRASWESLLVFAAYGVVPTAVIYGLRRQMDLISLGEEPAAFLGADVETLKRILYVAASLLTAAAVSVAGIIGFVGLVVPHGVRMVLGHMHGRLLPASFLVGGALLVTADTVARTVFAPVELPVGAVTALLGVPVFAILVRQWAS